MKPDADTRSAATKPEIHIRITVTEQDLRDALIRAVNGHPISPDLAWGIIHRWDRTCDCGK